jgi:hypothetical protein
VPLHDAIKAMPFPVIEVHMSNIAAREPWRAHSIISPAVQGTIQGLGWRSYTAGLRALAEMAREAERRLTWTRPAALLPPARGVIAACLAAMVVLVFGNVVLRYGFNSGIAVSEELSRWLFVWLTFMGASSACASTPTSAPTCWSAGSAARQEGLPGRGLRADAADVLDAVQRLARADEDQLGRHRAVERRLDGLVLQRRPGLQRLGGGGAARRPVEAAHRPGQRRPTW